MNTAPLISKVHYYLSLVLFFLCLFFLPNTQFGQSNIDLYHNHGDERMPFYEDEDLIFSGDIQFFRGSGSDYLMVMDTLKSYSTFDGELQLTWMSRFGYDEEFRYNKQKVWSLNSFSGELEPSSQTLIEYDEVGLISSDTFFFYISQLDSWVYNRYREIEHEQNLRRSTRYNWDFAESEWQIFSIEEIEFENDILSKRSTYFWRDHLQEFRLEAVLNREYEGSLLKYQREYRYDIQGDSLYLYDLIEYEYNDKDLLESVDFYRSNLNEGFELKPRRRLENTYNDLDQLIESIEFEPLSMELFDSVVIAKRDEVGGFNLQKDGENLKTISSDSDYVWDPIFRVIREYDHYGDLLNLVQYEILEEDPENWSGIIRRELERDNNYSMGTYIPFLLYGDDQHMLLSETDYELPSENIHRKVEYIYSQVFISNTNEVDPDIPLTLFPNPTKDVVHIELDQNISNSYNIHVVDMLGRLWHSGKFNSPMELNVQDWPTGIYNVVISDKERGTVVTRQVVKQ